MTAEDYELLSAYIDEMLTDGERSALEARLQTEKNLRDELNALQDTVALVKGLPRLKAPRNFTLTPEMLGMTAPAPRRKVIAFPMMALASAAASFLLIALGMILLFSEDNNAASEPMVAMPASEQPEIAEDVEALLYMNTTTSDSTLAVPITEDVITGEVAQSAPPMAESTLLPSEEDNAAEDFDGAARLFEASPEDEDEEQLLLDDAPYSESPAVMSADAANGSGGSGVDVVIKDPDQLIPPPLPDSEIMAQIEASATISANIPLMQRSMPDAELKEAETDTQSIVAVVLIVVGGVFLMTTLVLIYRWRMAT